MPKFINAIRFLNCTSLLFLELFMLLQFAIMIAKKKLVLFFYTAQINESNIFPGSLMRHLILGSIQVKTVFVSFMPRVVIEFTG